MLETRSSLVCSSLQVQCSAPSRRRDCLSHQVLLPCLYDRLPQVPVGWRSSAPACRLHCALRPPQAPQAVQVLCYVVAVCGRRHGGSRNALAFPFRVWFIILLSTLCNSTVASSGSLLCLKGRGVFRGRGALHRQIRGDVDATGLRDRRHAHQLILPCFPPRSRPPETRPDPHDCQLASARNDRVSSLSETYAQAGIETHLMAAISPLYPGTAMP